MSRGYLEAIVFILISAGVGFFLVFPKYQDLGEADQKVKQAKASVESRQLYLADIEAENNLLARYKNNLIKIESALPKDPDAPAVMDFLRAAALQSGLVLEDISYADASGAVFAEGGDQAVVGKTQEHPLRKYAVTTKITGKYPSLKDFLGRVEKTSRMIDVESIGVESSEAKKDGGVAAVDPEILNYVIKFYANYY